LPGASILGTSYAWPQFEQKAPGPRGWPQFEQKAGVVIASPS